MFNLLDQIPPEEFSELKEQIKKYATAMGGKNPFLNLLDTIRETTPHPLTSKKTVLEFQSGLMKWNKQIFRNNLIELSIQMNARNESSSNLMPLSSHKTYKNVSNMLRSLSPLTISVFLSESPSVVLFKTKAFRIIDKNTTQLEPLFEILFFAPMTTAKKLVSLAFDDSVE
jgi:hypothetical protein